MLIIPAIDLWEGKVVRFIKGNPENCIVYSNNPLEIAFKWQKMGAKLIHIVDLSAALGRGGNLEIIKDIVNKIDTEVEVGGGIRTVVQAKELIDLGVKRIIVGTKSGEKDFLTNLINLLGNDKLAVSVDTSESKVMMEGWQKETNLKDLDFIEYLNNIGIKWIVYTDILRDGTLQGINLFTVKKLSSFKNINFIICGGITSWEDIEKIKAESPFVWGVIVGRALYEGKLSPLSWIVA